MPQILDLTQAKLARPLFGKQGVPMQLLKNPPKVHLMCLSILREHKYIIQIYCHKNIELLSKYTVHKALERGWGIGEPKRDHCKEVNQTYNKQ